MTLVNLAVAMMMMMTLLVVCAYFMLIEDKVKASCLHFPRRMQGGNDDASLMISAQRVPDTQPKPELFFNTQSIPEFFFRIFGYFGYRVFQKIKPFPLILR